MSRPSFGPCDAGLKLGHADGQQRGTVGLAIRRAVERPARHGAGGGVGDNQLDIAVHGVRRCRVVGALPHLVERVDAKRPTALNQSLELSGARPQHDRLHVPNVATAPEVDPAVLGPDRPSSAPAVESRTARGGGVRDSRPARRGAGSRAGIRRHPGSSGARCGSPAGTAARVDGCRAFGPGWRSRIWPTRGRSCVASPISARAGSKSKRRVPAPSQRPCVVRCPTGPSCAGNRRVAWSCTCPVGKSGYFCKHCVAVALEVSDHEPEQRQPRQAERADGPDLRRYLAGRARSPAGGGVTFTITDSTGRRSGPVRRLLRWRHGRSGVADRVRRRGGAGGVPRLPPAVGSAVTGR
jgi:SWIM zinc finger